VAKKKPINQDIIHVLHLLRDEFPDTFDAIGERMDVNEDALCEAMKEVGVPDEEYSDGVPSDE
jgi:hypothetical protein